MTLLLSIPKWRASSLSVNPFLADEALASGSVASAGRTGSSGEGGKGEVLAGSTLPSMEAIAAAGRFGGDGGKSGLSPLPPSMVGIGEAISRSERVATEHSFSLFNRYSISSIRWLSCWLSF